MAMETVDLPIKNCDFPLFFVCLPEGIYHYCIPNGHGKLQRPEKFLGQQRAGDVQVRGIVQPLTCSVGSKESTAGISHEATIYTGLSTICIYIYIMKIN